MSATVTVDVDLVEQLILELQALREQRLPRPMWEYPSRIPKAVVAPEKYTSTLPAVVMAALRRYAAFRGGENINVIISEALRSYIPAEHFAAVLEEMRAEQRRLWTQPADPGEIRA